MKIFRFHLKRREYEKLFTDNNLIVDELHDRVIQNDTNTPLESTLEPKDNHNIPYAQNNAENEAQHVPIRRSTRIVGTHT